MHNEVYSHTDQSFSCAFFSFDVLPEEIPFVCQCYLFEMACQSSLTNEIVTKASLVLLSMEFVSCYYITKLVFLFTSHLYN